MKYEGLDCVTDLCLVENKTDEDLFQECNVRVCGNTFFDQWHETTQHDNKKIIVSFKQSLFLGISCCCNFIEAKMTQNDKFIVLCLDFYLKKDNKW